MAETYCWSSDSCDIFVACHSARHAPCQLANAGFSQRTPSDAFVKPPLAGVQSGPAETPATPRHCM